MLAHMRRDRLKMEAGAAGPVAEGRPIEPDPLPGIDVRLPIERQMVAEFGDDDLGDQRLGRQAAGHDVLGRMRLRDRRRAAPAGVFRPPGDEHAQLRRDQVEPLRDVLADLGHLAAAAGAKGAVRLDDPLHPRQMGGQLATIAVAGRSAAGRFALDGGFGLFLRGIENALGDLDILQRQVALVGAQLLGFGAELLAPEFADDDLEPAPRLFHLPEPPDARQARPASAPKAPSAWHSLRTGRRRSCPASITDRPPPPSGKTGIRVTPPHVSRQAGANGAAPAAPAANPGPRTRPRIAPPTDA